LLGWDIFDVDEVVPEYSMLNKRVDYMLMAGDNKVFLEVKKTGEDLEGHQGQLLMYAFEEGVKLAVLTNGIIWWFFLPLKEGKWEQREFLTLYILREDAEEVAQRFEDFLLKENVISGKAIEKAEEVIETRKKKEKIKETLPKAWNKIISEPGRKLVEILIDKVEMTCGYRPNEKDVIDFLLKHDFKVTTSIRELPNHRLNYGRRSQSEANKPEIPNRFRDLLVDSIVKVLGKSGGKAPKKLVQEEIYKEFSDIFSHSYWQERLKGGELRWRKTVAWAKERAKAKGYVKSAKESGSGIWELTEKGWKYYEIIKD